MIIKSIVIHNFRKLYSCKIDFDENTTLFVGANNSGKTSAMDALAKFIANRAFDFNDFTICHHKKINEIGEEWIKNDCTIPTDIKEWLSILPGLDIFLEVKNTELHYVIDILPSLDWSEGLLGVRLLYQPKEIEKLFTDYGLEYKKSRDAEQNQNVNGQYLFPKNLSEFVQKNIKKYFCIKTYKLDLTSDNSSLLNTDLETITDKENPLSELIKINMISAQRELSDPDNEKSDSLGQTKLSSQMRKYYNENLNPDRLPTIKDLEILSIVENACKEFDNNLKLKFKTVIDELEEVGYPGFTNPKITLKSKIETNKFLNHDSFIHYSLDSDNEELILPEKYNGLGYQNLISIIFDLMTFRDNWLKNNKPISDIDHIEPLHLVLIEEPEVHLHIQVQQVFIRNAYEILKKNNKQIGYDFKTQLIISTHSSHIVKEGDFSNLRYFRRLSSKKSENNSNIPTSKVVNLSNFFADDIKNLKKFTTKYLQTTHCDLFFADAVILVE